MNTTIIPNFFDEKELALLYKEINRGRWALNGQSAIKGEKGYKEYNPLFWCNDIFYTDAKILFTNKLSAGLNNEIQLKNLYVNGQAHGQCGDWHTDTLEENKDETNFFTLVYFYKEWLPEYGGHLLIKETNGVVTSYLPEFNKGVLFNSTLEHIGLEPTAHCKTQRESIACKFKIIT
jgi:hypothetical protein